MKITHCMYIQKCTVHTTDCATLCYANEMNDEKKHYPYSNIKERREIKLKWNAVYLTK